LIGDGPAQQVVKRKAAMRELTLEETKQVSAAGSDHSSRDDDEESNHNKRNTKKRDEDRAERRDTEPLPIG
jgi:hypothetical protein